MRRGLFDEQEMNVERFSRVIAASVREGFSDVHITGGYPVVFRRNGVISFDKSTKWKHEEVDDLVSKLLSPSQLQMLKKRWSVDLAMSIENARIRMNVFNTTRGLSLAVRLLPGNVPTINNLNLHPSFHEICKQKSGLILICGATGSGKSTTIAAMIDEINRTRSGHIITLEDPIEYRFCSHRCFIEQRELGTHMPSFEQGLLDVLREDPDVIVVGELREPETIRLTLNAAESGHLVIASLHASHSEDAVYRICNSFPSELQEAVHMQLASTLVWLVVQQLELLERVSFRIPVLSILRGTAGVKGMIRDRRLSQIESALQTGRAEGMFTMDAYRKEYLSRRERFTPPYESFKPSAEGTSEILYRSPLLDSHMPARKAPKAAAITDTEIPIVQPKPLHEDDHRYYVIEEEADVHELIKQMRRLGDYKGD
jgi:pilus retraction protein PilT